MLTKTGIAIPGIGRDDVLEAVFCLPTLAEQHRIVAKVNELMSLCDMLESEQASNINAHQVLVENLLAELTQKTPSPQPLSRKAGEGLRKDHATSCPPSTASRERGLGGEGLSWQRIATHFDTLFTTEHSIDQLKQTILQLAVMGKLVAQDPQDEPASVLLKKIAAEKAQLVKAGKIKKQEPLPPIAENEKPFELPNGWEWVRLEELFNIIVDCPHSTAKFQEQGFLCLDTNSFKQGKLIKDKFRFVSKETFEARNARLAPEARDIVFAREGSVGESVVIPERVKCCLGQRVMLFRPSLQLEAEFLRLTISSSGALELLLSLHKGIGAKHVNVSDMRAYAICLPPAKEQHRIVAKVDELMTLCDQLKARIRTAQTTQLHLADVLAEQALCVFTSHFLHSPR